MTAINRIDDKNPSLAQAIRHNNGILRKDQVEELVKNNIDVNLCVRTNLARFVAPANCTLYLCGLIEQADNDWVRTIELLNS
jgi:hypothetical protein